MNNEVLLRNDGPSVFWENSTTAGWLPTPWLKSVEWVRVYLWFGSQGMKAVWLRNKDKEVKLPA